MNTEDRKMNDTKQKARHIVTGFSLWRRVRDLNPRYQNGTQHFQCCSFGRSDNSTCGQMILGNAVFQLLNYYIRYFQKNQVFLKKISNRRKDRFSARLNAKNHAKIISILLSLFTISSQARRLPYKIICGDLYFLHMLPSNLTNMHKSFRAKRTEKSAYLPRFSIFAVL